MQKSFFGRPCGCIHIRAGNVIGGGDFANDRIIPDCIRAATAGREIVVRNPYSHGHTSWCWSRWRFMAIAMKQYEDLNYQGYYNVGPDDRDCVTTGELADLFLISGAAASPG